jgi:lysyl endopeptidase
VLATFSLIGGCVNAAQDAGLPPTAVADGSPGVTRETHEARDFSVHVILPPVTADELTRVMAPAKGAPLQIGFPRPIPAEYRGDLSSLLTWRRADGAMTAGFTVTSPAARALRLGLRVARLPDGAEFRFFGVSGPTQTFGPFTASDMVAGAKDATDTGNDGAVFWSPVVAGDTIGVEIRLRDPDHTADLRVSLVQVSHLRSPER